MKTANKGQHGTSREPDELRKAKRLTPLRKSGKERHALYGALDDDDDADAEEYPSRPRRESAYDYLDDEE